MKKRLLIFTILLTILLTFLAIRGRMESEKNSAVSPLPAETPAVPESSGNATGQTISPADDDKAAREMTRETSAPDVAVIPNRETLASVGTIMPAAAGTVSSKGIEDVPVKSAVAPGLRRLVVAFDDIPCPGHIRTIIDALARVDGVSDVAVFYDDYRGEMDYDPSLATPDDIIRGMPPDCPARVVEDRPRT